MCSTMCEGDPPVRPLAQLERELCELAAHIAAATCRWLILLAEWDARGGWAEWGVNSCAEWLGWRCSIGPGTAREHVRVARALTALPVVREVFGTGELSYSKVRAITRVAEPETEAQLVALARHATGAQLERVVRGYRGALAVRQGTAERAHEERYLRWYHDEHGSLMLRARVPAEDGALLLAALNAAPMTAPAMTTATGDDAAEPVERTATAEQRDADALVAVARTALDAPDVARTNGDPCELVVHVDIETLAGDEIRARSELDRGPALAPETIRRLGCDTALVRIVERDGTPLSVGRRTRTIPPALRRALRSRDAGCRFPGCTHQRFLHAHHIQHWARGGPTELDNLVQLCSHHHRLVHEGGYHVEPANDRTVRFRRPDGRLIPDVCQGARARGPGLERQNTTRGITVNADTCMAKSAGDPIDYGIAVEGLLRDLLGPG